MIHIVRGVDEIHVVVVGCWSDNLDVIVEDPKTQTVTVGENVRFYCHTITAPVSIVSYRIFVLSSVSNFYRLFMLFHVITSISF